MELHYPKLTQFLNAIVANSVQRAATVTIAEVIADGLLVFRSFPENISALLFLLEEVDFSFRFSSSIPKVDGEYADTIFNELQKRGIIGNSLDNVQSVMYKNSTFIDNDFIVVPLAVPTSVLGVLILENIRTEDTNSSALMKLCELSANQFAYALHNTTLVQRLTYNQSVLEQKVAARTMHLEQIQRELKTILDCIQTGIVIIDAITNEIVEVNLAAIEIMQEPRDSLVGKNYSTYFLEHEVHTISTTDQVAESTLIKSNGEFIPIIQTSVTVHLGANLRIVHSFIDISSRKITEEALIKANTILEERVEERTFELNSLVHKLTNEIIERERAEESARIALEREKELSELKSNFVSMVSHEFRTPLTTILSYTQILQLYRGKWTEEDENKYLKNIQIAVGRMTDLLNDVLFIGSSSSGGIAINLRIVNLYELCTSVIEELKFTDASKHTIHLKYDFVGSGIRTDEKLLRKVMINLLSNSAKYSPINKDIELDIRREHNTLIIKVSDNGIGIPREYLENVFESFRRAENVGNISGTGLGLAIVKQSVELLGGTITVHSEEKVGTEFRVELPIQ